MISEHIMLMIAMGIVFALLALAAQVCFDFDIFGERSPFMGFAALIVGPFILSFALVFGSRSLFAEHRNIAISRCIESGWYPENYCRTGTNRVQKEFAFPLEDLKLASANCMKSQYSKKKICTSSEFFDVKTIISAFGPEPTMVVCGRANDKFCQKD